LSIAGNSDKNSGLNDLAPHRGVMNGPKYD
jgi:hypothetical protein